MDFAVRRDEPHGIRKKIPENLPQPLGIAADHDGTIRLHRDRDICIRSDGTYLFHDLLHDRHDVHHGEAQWSLARVQLR